MNNRAFTKKIIAKWIDRFDLSSWHIKLRLYQKLPLFNQFCDFHKSEMTTKIGLNIARQDRAEIEHSAAHELAHLIEAPQNRVFDNLVEQFIPKDQRTAWGEQYNLAQNESIEHWLRIVYKLAGEEYPPHREEKETA